VLSLLLVYCTSFELRLRGSGPVLPFVAIRPILQFSRIPKIIGCIFISPILIFDVLFVLLFVGCSPQLELHHYRTNSCIQELGKLEQGNYSVHLLRDCGGGAPVSFTVWIEQRLPILPGLYLLRTVDSFYGAYEGKLISVSGDEVRLQIPVGVPGSGWEEKIDRTYKLKRHVYF
jgi:hypothetical protein